MDGSHLSPSHLNPFTSEVAQQNADTQVKQQADDASLQASFEEHVSGVRDRSGSVRRRRG